MEEKMSWVSVEQDKCTSCGLCVTRCVRCFADNDGEITADANADNCNLCGHCVALCPTSAIEHHQMDMNGFVEYTRKASIDTATFIQFLRERRSHRHFKDKPVSRQTLDMLIDICRYAPTGSNVQDFEIIVTRDQEKIKQYSDLTIDCFMTLIEPARKKLQALKAAGKQDTDEFNFCQRNLDRGKLFDLARNAGFDPILHKAPAVMIFHSPSITSTPKDNCVIASTTAALTARTMGLEACYIGLMEFAANSDPALVQALDLPQGHLVYSIIILGYPKLKFLRAVDRKPMEVRWE
jgi:nitroreductase/NAD-dependent dihydropyrimidine dehydrogenase PreA subunit